MRGEGGVEDNADVALLIDGDDADADVGVDKNFNRLMTEGDEG